MNNDPRYFGKKRKTSPVPYLAVMVFLCLAFLISSKLRSTGNDQRLEEIKTEKEIVEKMQELGYPGDDPTQAPAEGWEWKEDEDPQAWYNPETGGRIVPVLKEDGTLDHWYYLSAQGKTYLIQEDGTYVREEE